MKSSRISRVVRLLTALQAGKNYTANDLAKILKTSRRTIFRDLKELQTIGVPYHFDSKTGGYAVDPEFFLPPIDLNLKEALSLLLMVHKTRNNIQLPFKDSALLAALKIENNLPAAIRQYCNTALLNISTNFIAQATMSQLDKTFSSLQKAIIKKQKVNIRYDSFFDKGIIELQLHPYHLFYNHRAWYIIGFSEKHKSTRTFKLNRIKSMKFLEKRFIDGEKFDLQEYLGRAWSMIPEGKIHNIKLRFLPKVARNVAEIQWHSTQTVTFDSDGAAIMRLRVDGLNEILWWILGYGDQVQVLAPQALKNKVVDIAQKTIELNKNN